MNILARLRALLRGVSAADEPVARASSALLPGGTLPVLTSYDARALSLLIEAVDQLGFADDLAFLALGNGLAMCGDYAGAVQLYSVPIARMPKLVGWLATFRHPCPCHSAPQSHFTDFVFQKCSDMEEHHQSLL